MPALAAALLQHMTEIRDFNTTGVRLTNDGCASGCFSAENLGWAVKHGAAWIFVCARLPGPCQSGLVRLELEWSRACWLVAFNKLGDSNYLDFVLIQSYAAPPPLASNKTQAGAVVRACVRCLLAFIQGHLLNLSKRH